MVMKSFVLALPLALLAALSVAPSAGTAPLAPAALHSASAMSFSDAAGDSGVAADITEVDVGNDLVAGPIVFWVTLANRPDALVADDGLIVLLNTDRDAATGAEGSDYAIVAVAESVGLFRWDGAAFAPLDAASLSARFSKADKAMRIAVHPNDLGGTTGFDFFVASLSGDAHDSAPNGPPAWSYTFASGRIGLAVVGSAVVPKKPVAGKRLEAGILVARSDIGELLGLGKVSCTLKIGTKSVRAVGANFRSGVAVCAWNLPKAAKGQLIRGTVSVTYGGATAKKAFSARAR
jgi:hypothetical protein